MTPRTVRRGTAALLLLGLTLTAGLAGCAKSGSTNASSDTRGAAAPMPAKAQDKPENLNAAPAQDAAGQGAPAQAGAPQQGGAVAGKPNLPATTGQRSIVYTGSITVRVDNVNAKAAQLTSLAIGAGGLVGKDDRQMDDGRSTATLTLRIPAAKFTETLDQIGHLGTEQTRNVSTEDVTAAVIDVAARIQSQQASVDRVRALLARAQSLSDITSIESELARREADLESLKAQQSRLADLTALSTIAVTLLGPDAAVPAKPKPAETGFLAGLKSGWRAFAASVQVVLTVIGAVLPFVVLIGLPVWLVVLGLRRRRLAQLRPAVALTGTAPSPGGTGPGPLSSETTPPKAGSEG
jgi:hypothetical protein